MKYYIVIDYVVSFLVSSLLLMSYIVTVSGLLLGLVLVICLPTQAFADDIGAQIVSGQIRVHYGVGSMVDLDAGWTSSISSVIDDGSGTPSGTQVFCQDIAAGEVEGVTNIIPVSAIPIFLVGWAWSDAGCTGTASPTGSVNRYLVLFGPPPAPIMLPPLVTPTP